MSTPINKTQSGLVLKGQGQVKGFVVNSHASGIVKIIDGLNDGVQATGTLTTSGAMVPGDYAKGTLTSTGTAIADGDTVVVGASGGTQITYIARTAFSTGLSSAANEVLIGSTADGSAFLANLQKAVNGTGVQGVNYSYGTVASPDVIGYGLTATILKLGFRTPGTAGNSYTTTETSTQLSFGGATLAGGVSVAAALFTIDTTVYTALLTLGDTLGLAVPYQVLWVTSESVFLDNFKAAVNGAGNPGTDFSLSTPQHPSVTAQAKTGTTLVFTARKLGVAGNSIATTETVANYAFGATTLGSGTGTNSGTILFNSMTLSAVATTGERYIDLLNSDFTAGLFITIGGTADLTFGVNSGNVV